MKTYIERPLYVRQLIDNRDSGEIKIITGSRRSGKSWLLNRFVSRLADKQWHSV